MQKIWQIVVSLFEGWYVSVITIFWILMIIGLIWPKLISPNDIFSKDLLIVSIPFSILVFPVKYIQYKRVKAKLTILQANLNQIEANTKSLLIKQNNAKEKAEQFDNSLKAKLIHPWQLKAFRGIEFEEYLYDAFTLIGYGVRKTPSSNDYGVDLILQKDNRNIAVQVKGVANPVGISAIQEVFSGKVFYDCTDAMVVTNSSFTRNAITHATKLGVLLMDRDKLLKILPNSEMIKNRNAAWRKYYLIEKDVKTSQSMESKLKSEIGEIKRIKSKYFYK